MAVNNLSCDSCALSEDAYLTSARRPFTIAHKTWQGASEASDTSVVLKDFPLVFIRGPFVAEVGERATVETSVDGNVVGLRQGKILATAFHPELTDDTRIHELFLSL